MPSLKNTRRGSQSDFVEPERRGVAGDIAQGVNGDAEQSLRFWREWMA
jgi:hypothetical protein